MNTTKDFRILLTANVISFETFMLGFDVKTLDKIFDYGFELFKKLEIEQGIVTSNYMKTLIQYNKIILERNVRNINSAIVLLNLDLGINKYNFN